MNYNKSKFKIISYSTHEEVSEKLAENLFSQLSDVIFNNGFYSLAVSGGKTPALFFEKLRKQAIKNNGMKNVKVFFCDERAVSIESKLSNFRLLREQLQWEKMYDQPEVYRIFGEIDPVVSADEYDRELKKHLTMDKYGNLLSATILGLGNDGHTASLFPKREFLFNSPKWSVPNFSPDKTSRITLTPQIILRSAKLIFLVTGKEKKETLNRFINEPYSQSGFPARWIAEKYNKIIEIWTDILSDRRP